jgi:hypothetical protein
MLQYLPHVKLSGNEVQGGGVAGSSTGTLTNVHFPTSSTQSPIKCAPEALASRVKP